jgi:hypothetical protein
MTLELTIQDMFNKYPTLYKDRSDCLNHLFCCIGNGYDWDNGELVYIGRDERAMDIAYLESCLVNGKAHQYNKMSLRAEARHYASLRSENIEPHLQKVADEIEEKYFMSLPDDVYHKRERKYRWYFYLGGYCTNYAYLFNYPSDIKPDWLAGIEECKAMLREDGYDIDNPNEHLIDTKANWEESIAAHKKREWMVK